MRFRNQLLWTSAIQGSGAVALFAAIILIGRTMGPQAQGLFSRIKSEVEFVAAFALFGMPQAVLFFVTLKRMSSRSAISLTGALGAISLVGSVVYVLLTRSVSPLYCALFGLACASFVVHSMLRVLVLAHSSTVLFNVVTALPQVSLFILIAAAAPFGMMTAQLVSAAFLFSFIVGSATAGTLLLGSGKVMAPAVTREASLAEMVAYGAATAVASALNSAAVLLWIRHVENTGQAAVGVFTMGLMLAQVVVTPFNYASPLLFKRWIETPHQPRIQAALFSGVATLAVISVALQAAGLMPFTISLASYGELLRLKWSFAIAAVCEVMLRVPLSALYAAGKPWLFALAEAARIAILFAALATGAAPSLWAAAWWWTAAAALAACVHLVAVARIDASRRTPFSLIH